MSPFALGRLWSLPLVVLAVLLSMLGFVPKAQAEDVITNSNAYFELHYDCLQGQTVVFDPGQFQVAIKDEAGNTVGYDDIVSASIDVFPIAQFSSEGQRSQGQWYPGTITSFTQEAGLPLNDNKTIWIRASLEWTNPAGVSEYQQGRVTCSGGATDSDGDGVADEVDKCPSVPVNGSADGCPSDAVLQVVSVQGGYSLDGVPGSVTLTVTNPVDGGGAESYVVEADGGSAQMTEALADGQTSTAMTFAPMPGVRGACATSEVSGKSSCITFTVPDNTQRANAGTVVFTTTCTGLKWTVKNTGRETSVYNVRVAAPDQSTRFYEWKLAPGQSQSGVSPSYWYRLSVSVTMTNQYNADVPNPNVGSAQWTQPAGCTPPMSGGDRLVSWGKVTRTSATPRVTVTTKAYYAIYGYQVKGKGVVWFMTARPGTHTFRLTNLKVPRHKQRTVRLWVRYKGADAGLVFGTHAFTGWHTYKRR